MVTVFIVILTSICSIIAFQQPEIMLKFDFRPYRINIYKEYFRFFTHAFLHVDWIHLIINMLVLFSFGRHLEQVFSALGSSGSLSHPWLAYILLYSGGIIISTITTYFRNINNPEYIAVGASGAVSSVLFASIFFSPLGKVFFYGIIPVPGILFGILYLLYSSYMSKKGKDNINHDAHFWGAVYGMLFPLFIDISLLKDFLNQLGF